MVRRKAPEKGDTLEGFQPQPIERVLGPRPSAVEEELTKREPTKLYLNDSDVPEHMRRVLPPVRDTAPPGAPTLSESGAAIQQMLDNIARKRREKAIADAQEPPRMRVVRAAAEEFQRKREVVEVEDDGQEETGPAAA